MASQWYCKTAENGKESGPVSAEQLKTLAAKGRLKTEHLVRQGTAGNWVPAGKVNGLFAEGTGGNGQSGNSAAKKTPLKKAEALPTAKPLAAAPAAEPLASVDSVPGPNQPLPAAEPVPVASQPVPIANQPVPVVNQPVSTPAAGVGAFAIQTEQPAAVRGASGDGEQGGMAGGRKKKKSKGLVIGLLATMAGLAVLVVVLIVLRSGDDKGEEAVASDKKEERKEPTEAEKMAALEAAENADPARPGEAEAPGDPPAPAEPEQPVQPEGPAWANVVDGEDQRCDPVIVEVTSAAVAVPRYTKQLPGALGLDQPCLLVRLRLTNTSEEEKLEYEGWGSSGRSKSFVQATDGKGNTYKLKHFPKAIVEGRHTKAVSMYPGETVEDLMVFERPLPAAKYVRLVLPASVVGKKGDLRFELSSELFEREDPGVAVSETDPGDGFDAPGENSGRPLDPIQQGIKDLAESEGPAETGPNVGVMPPGAQPPAEGGDEKKPGEGEDEVPEIMRQIQEFGGGDGSDDKEYNFEDIIRPLDPDGRPKPKGPVRREPPGEGRPGNREQRPPERPRHER